MSWVLEQVYLRHLWLLLRLWFFISLGTFGLNEALRDIFTQGNNEAATTLNLIDTLLPELIHFLGYSFRSEVSLTKLTTGVVTPCIKESININGSAK